MKKQLVVIPLALLLTEPARADVWGGDIPLLTEIVTNTLNTLNELKNQTSIMEDSMSGINDRIFRISTIQNIVQPGQWDQWRDPSESLRRLRLIYETMPREYKSDKSDLIESEISNAMSLVAQVAPGATTTFQSGKQLENTGANASPGVAAKLAASGMGSVVAMDAQSVVIQSHITSLLAQMLADANDKENRGVISKGQCFGNVSANIGTTDSKFSSHVFPKGMQ